MKLLLTALCASFMIIPAAFASECEKGKCDKEKAKEEGTLAGKCKKDCDKDEAKEEEGTLADCGKCDKKKDDEKKDDEEKKEGALA
jgi:hypothetical protein